MSKLYWVVLDGEDIIYAEDKGIISSYWVCLEPCNERICNALKKCEEYGLKKSREIIIKHYLENSDPKFGIYENQIIDGVSNIETVWDELDDNGYDWYIDVEMEVV